MSEESSPSKNVSEMEVDEPEVGSLETGHSESKLPETTVDAAQESEKSKSPLPAADDKGKGTETASPEVSPEVAEPEKDSNAATTETSRKAEKEVQPEPEKSEVPAIVEEKVESAKPELAEAAVENGENSSLTPSGPCKRTLSPAAKCEDLETAAGHPQLSKKPRVGQLSPIAMMTEPAEEKPSSPKSKPLEADQKVSIPKAKESKTSTTLPEDSKSEESKVATADKPKVAVKALFDILKPQLLKLQRNMQIFVRSSNLKMELISISEPSSTESSTNPSPVPFEGDEDSTSTTESNVVALPAGVSNKLKELWKGTDGIAVKYISNSQELIPMYLNNPKMKAEVAKQHTACLKEPSHKVRGLKKQCEEELEKWKNLAAVYEYILMVDSTLHEICVKLEEENP